MSGNAERRSLRSRLWQQRCFYLFVLLLALIAAAPSISVGPRGAMAVNILDTLIIVAAAAAAGRSVQSFFVVVCAAVPTVLLRWISLETDNSRYYDISLWFHAAIYLIAIALLLRYVFSRSVLDIDRLYGAAATYLMIGVMWSFCYAIVDRKYPQSFAIRGSTGALELTDLVYLSFSTLTTTGFGDVIPLTRVARAVCVIETIVGQLFIAILIARLVGFHPSWRNSSERSDVGGVERP